MFDSIAIVLVSYNSQSFLDDCLTSLKNQDFRDVQIIIVDNSSPDNSNEFIEKNYPDIVLLKESVNHGFGGACNIGARYALDHGADYVLFLNTDTIADLNLVSELAKYADSSTVTTCFTYNDKNNLNPWYSGGSLNRTNLYSEQTLYPYNPLHEPIEVSFISGCCMMIHKDVFDKVGFFDSDYFMYYEDAEYCARMLKKGIKLLYIQSTKLFHYEGGSQKKRLEESRLGVYYGTRNRLLLACQHPELIDIPVHSFIKNAMQEAGYFSPRFKYKISYEKKGVVDFFKSVTGQRDFFDVEYSEGFWNIEHGEKFDFCHCMEEESYLKLCNYSDSRKSVHLRFNLLPAPTLDHGELDIFFNNKYLGLFNLPCSFDDIIEFSAQEVKYLKFKSRLKPISLPNDSRTFTFTIANIIHNETSSIEIIKSSSIFGEESDLNDHWNWVTGKESEIKVCNFTDDNAVCRVKFSLLPAPTKESGNMDIYIDKKIYRRNICLPTCIDDVIEIESCKAVSVDFVYKDELVYVEGDNRQFAFQLRNLKCRQIERKSLEVTKPIGFFEEETDSYAYWNWAVAKKSEVRIYNFTDKKEVYRIQFTLFPAPRKESGNMDIYIDKKIYRRNICLPTCIDDVIEIESCKAASVDFVYKDELVYVEGDNRQFAFQLRNLKCRQIYDSLSKLRNNPFDKNKRFAVYGTGVNATRFCEKIGKKNLVCFFDRTKDNGEFCGKPILKFCDETLRNYNIKQIVIAASEKYIKEIYERISPVCKKNGINVYDVYDIDLDYKYTIEGCIQN